MRLFLTATLCYVVRWIALLRLYVTCVAGALTRDNSVTQLFKILRDVFVWLIPMFCCCICVVTTTADDTIWTPRPAIDTNGLLELKRTENHAEQREEHSVLVSRGVGWVWFGGGPGRWVWIRVAT